MVIWVFGDMIILMVMELEDSQPPELQSDAGDGVNYDLW